MKIEYEGEGKVTTKYLSGSKIDEIIVKKEADGKKYYYIRDGLNSVRMVIDERGNIVQRLDYDAFGEPKQTKDLRQKTTETTFAFTGREYDTETGLYFYRARQYDANIGRFLSEDPIGILGGMNLYAYCGSNPVNWIDPMGMDRDVYIQGAHGYVVFDTYDSNGNVTGSVGFEFGPENFTDSIYGEGVITEFNFSEDTQLPTDVLFYHIDSNSAEDIAGVDVIRGMMEFPPDYSNIPWNTYNCWDWIADIIGAGMTCTKPNS